MDAKSFFERLFAGSVCPEARLVIWSLPSRRSAFNVDAETAAADAMARCEECEDVYFGVGLIGPNVSSGRGKASDVVLITSLWADIDIGKPETPSSVNEGLTLCDRIGGGYAPSMVVSSGNGLHAYWIGVEPIAAKTNEGEWSASTICQSWSAHIKRHCEALGYKLDSVSDVSRVLRVPGTVNYKDAKNPKPVEDIRTAPFVDLCEMADAVFSSVVVEAPTTPVVHSGSLVLRADAFPDPGRLSVCEENDSRFARTWNRKRRDLKDKSASGYDQALACFAVSVGWTDQEIADLIIGFRRKHQLDLTKALRPGTKTSPGYVERTIATARRGMEHNTPIEELVSEAVHQAEVEEAANATCESTLGEIRKRTGVPIAKVLRLGDENCRYWLHLDDGTRVEIGTTQDLMSQATTSTRILDRTKILIPHMKTLKWRETVGRIVAVAEQVSMAEGDVEFVEWLRLYLTDNHPRPEDESAEAVTNGQPFTKDGEHYIQVTRLRAYLWAKFGQRFNDEQAIRSRLSAIGWNGKRVYSWEGNGSLCRYYWHGKLEP